MVETHDFPLIISPNLGCPLIISLDELKHGKTIPLIIAGRYSGSATPLSGEFKNTLYLRRSRGNGEQCKEIPLVITDEPEEIIDWNQLSDIKDTEDTRRIINSEFHYKVMGENTRYWKINVSIGDKNEEEYKALLLRYNNNGKSLPCLYDIVYTDESGRWERINYHSLQFVENFKNACNFIHLTDLHIATRNDAIIDEVLKVKEKNVRGRMDIWGFLRLISCLWLFKEKKDIRAGKNIRDGYINFNENVRKFIKKANELADKGELDFVVITGDLVDFAFHGWADEPNYDENNWKTFVNIITGLGLEGTARNNSGIKVAIFTSTGNHDWRLHPYDPNTSDYNRKSYGLTKEELTHYNFKNFDSTEYPGDKRAKLSEEITSDAFKKLNLNALLKSDRWKIKIEKFSNNIFGKLMPYISPLLGAGIGKSVVWKWALTNKHISIIILCGAGFIAWLINKCLKKWARKAVDYIVDNPIHAEACALHYYFRYINPYFDYAFRYGDHYFVVMDTGADVFVGQLLDNKKVKDLKRISLADNILGGAPDSRAFDDEQAYYNWSQIVWLEKALATIPNNTNKNRSFIFLHAPPINPPDDVDLSQVQESKLKLKDKWIPEPKEHNRIYEFFQVCVAYVKSKFCKHGNRVLQPGDECNLTYGSVNHYLSQFFYLCLGYRESELVGQNEQCNLKPVDIVFSGHAHKNIEFRIEKDNDLNHKIRIYYDLYSKNSYNQWGKSPVIVQTAACGVPGGTDKNSPYFRMVNINESGDIKSFGTDFVENTLVASEMICTSVK